MEGDSSHRSSPATPSLFQSTPSAWRETHCLCFCLMLMHISIHSLRMEGDTDIRNISIQEIYFNPLPPHGGRPRRPADTLQERVISIHSLRMEGDSVVLRWIRAVDYFNPLPPHGGRLYEVSADWLIGTFQSTPSAWRETHTKNQTVKNEIFQSTPSAWRETKISCQ